MKYIFFGTPDFGAAVLEKLIVADMAPAAVVTNPDRPVGRRKILTASPVKILIQDSKFKPQETTKILQPEKLSDIRRLISEIHPEFGILAAYGKIIPREIFDVFPKGIIVVHPSLLPEYRGATPIQSAILAGEKETGTTLIVMDEKIDHGPILATSKWQIADSDTYEMLSKKLAELSADLLIKTLPKYLSGEIVPQPQDHARATYTRKFTSEEGYIGESSLREAMSGMNRDEAISVWQKIRALNPEPGIWTLLEKKTSLFSASGQVQKGQSGYRMKILAADMVSDKLVLRKIQLEGEKPRTI